MQGGSEMTMIKINADTLNMNAIIFQKDANRVMQISQELYDSYHAMEIEYTGLCDLNNRMVNEMQQGRLLSSELETMSNFLRRAAAALEDADRKAAKGLESLNVINLNPCKSYSPSTIATLGIPATMLSWLGWIIKPVEPYSLVGREGKVIWPVPKSTFREEWYGEMQDYGFKTKRKYKDGTPIQSDLPYGHTGIDIQPLIRGHNDPVIASTGGKIISIEDKITGYGKSVVIESIINGKKYRIRYGHLNSISEDIIKCFNSGDELKPSVEIGKMGTTGNSSGVHLHYEVKLYEETMNEVTHKTKITETLINPIDFLKTL